MRKIFALCSVVFALCAACAARGAPDKNLVAAAETYLNSITGLSGNFNQTANGKKNSGTFSMLRPGKVRLDYRDMPVQLISDGKDLYFFDRSLDQITTVPLTSTPAGILVRKNINLHNSDIVVTESKQNKDTFSLAMHMKDNEGAGHMIVAFDNAPVKLNSWTVMDATGNKTDVAFDGLKAKTDFAKNYFQIQRHKTVSTAGGDSYYD
ncbi:MAG: outer membrane lipoprotein carrier protein LolA [Rickettsiales bacterium]|jgi:outer membrane lipoprotein-sorting protein|nr:outer membrane lipoprotein carrier protein LolA [Rickettsiales bacterium]